MIFDHLLKDRDNLLEVQQSIVKLSFINRWPYRCKGCGNEVWQNVLPQNLIVERIVCRIVGKSFVQSFRKTHLSTRFLED